MTFQEPTLWKHQREGVDRALSNLSPKGYAFFFEPGCVAGDTLIRFNRNGKGFTLPIEQAYFQWIGQGKSPRKWDLSKPTYVRSDGGDKICLNQVGDIIYSGEKEVFSLELEDGKRLECTSDHRIMTDKGFVELSKLLPGDMILVDNVTKLSATGSKKLAPKGARDILVNVKRGHPFARKVLAGGYARYRIEIHRALYEAHINKMSLNEYKKAIATRPDTLVYIDPKKYHIHHKDENHFNNKIDNLECLTIEEHRKHHCKGVRNFPHLRKQYSKVVGVSYIGKKATYDISCAAPYHSFVANGIVVHNCGKTLTTITTLRHLFTRDKRPMKTLILGPSIVVKNWADEIEQFSRMGSLVCQLTGSKRERIEKSRSTIS